MKKNIKTNHQIIIIILIICMIPISVLSQKLDSLVKSLNTEKNLILKIQALGVISDNCDKSNIEKYCSLGLDLIKKTFPKASIKDKNILLVEEARLNNNLSYYFTSLSLFSKAEDYSSKAILSLEKNHLDTTLLNSSNNNLAAIYMALRKYQAAIAIFKKNLTYDYYKKNNSFISIDLHNIAIAFNNLNQTDSSLKYCRSSIQYKQKSGAIEDLVSDYNLLGSIYLNNNQIDSSRFYFNKSFELALTTSDVNTLKTSYYWLAIVEEKVGNDEKAEEYFKLSISYGNEIGNLNTLSNNHEHLYKIYEKRKDFGKALFHYKLFKTFNDSLLSQKIEKEFEVKQIKFDYSKKEIELTDKQEKELALSNEEKKRQRLIIIFGIISLILVIMFLGFVVNRARILSKQKKFIQKQSDLLSEKQIELVDKNLQLDKKNTTITENIHYAQNIQDSLIPSEQKLQTILNKECFVFFKPKDIVSGDFYWSYAKNNKQLLVVADCTGHGVTGAFISILAIKAFEKIVANYELSNLKTIMKELHKEFILTFGDDETNHFGIELTMCCFDNVLNTVLITGSSNSVCIVNNNELIQYQYDNMSIGTKGAKLDAVKIDEVVLEPNSMIYLYTDGFQDQKGGDLNKKFLSKNLRKKLSENSLLKMSFQKGDLMTTFENWRKNNEQIDDVSVIGIKI